MTDEQFTTISLRPETRDRVRARKQGGESYNAVIERLLAENESATDDHDV